MPLIPPAPPAIEIRYVGGPTDPTFDVPGPYRSGSVTLQKTEGPAVSAGELGRIDVVLLSHDQHPDNLDPAGRALIAHLPTLTTWAGAERLGGSSVGLTPGSLASWRRRRACGSESRPRPPVTALPGSSRCSATWSAS
jgi:hypothetical protein